MVVFVTFYGVSTARSVFSHRICQFVDSGHVRWILLFPFFGRAIRDSVRLGDLSEVPFQGSGRNRILPHWSSPKPCTHFTPILGALLSL